MSIGPDIRIGQTSTAVAEENGQASVAEEADRTLPSASTVFEEADTSPITSKTLEIIERRRLSPVRGHRGWLVRRLLLLADIVGISLAFLAAQLLFSGGGGGDVRGTVADPIEYLIFLATLPFWVVGAKLYGLYDNDEERTDHSTADEIVTFVHFVTVGSWLLYLGALISQIAVPSTAKLAAFWAFAIVLVSLGRIGARSIARRRPEYLQNAVVMGAGPVGQLIARKLRQHPEYGINLVGFVDSIADEDRGRVGNPALIGSPDDLPELGRLYDLDRVLIAHSADDLRTLALTRELNELDIQVDIVPRLYDLVSPGVSIHTVEGFPLLGLPPMRLSNSSRLLKRATDMFVASIALLLFAPLFLLAAGAIKLDSRGQVFFKQIRRGQRDELFWLYKFRTMVADADARKGEFAHLNVYAQKGDPRMFKIDGDPRVTRVGRVLRHYMLDELPQLINVLKGDMSLVGPRPLILEEDEQVLAWGRKRLDLKPGMTGLWQVLGRQAMSFEEMVKLDYLYVTTWSFGGDFRLLLRTIPVVVKGEGGTF